MFRVYEAPEIERVASPCYFKIEPSPSQADIYKPLMRIMGLSERTK